MLDIKFIREEKKTVARALKNRGVNIDLEKLLDLDEKRRAQIQKIDLLRSKQKAASAKIADLKGAKKTAAIKAVKATKAKLQAAEEKGKVVNQAFETMMYLVPNLPFKEVPVGASEKENKVVREVGNKPTFSFKPKEYISIAETLDLIDTKRAAKVSGARFAYIKREAALLEMALVQFVFARLTDETWIKRVAKNAELTVRPTAFVPLIPPVMIRPEAFRAMGKLDPGQEEERFFLPKDNLYLVGSAEHSTGSMHMDETLDEKALPLRYIAFSTCFRREAGSYGKDTKGIIRMHQFDKLEMFSFCLPDTSKQEHRLFLAIQEQLMQELELPYRVVHICTGDMVSTDAEQFDIEAWLPGQNGGKGQYRETHSTSNSTDFQARRLQTRYKGKDTKGYVHTLNGTALAMSRIPVAIMENYQQEDGSIAIPKVLQESMLGIKRIAR